MDTDRRIFALDIGTRSVVGIILEKMEDQFHVIDMFSKEHKERSMLDGQIHDVLTVSKVITEIKNELEKKHGPLHKVCVAAAGRSLKTERADAVVKINGKPMMQKEDILHLELSAVQNAQAKAAEKHLSANSQFYYCVGYSILQYRLDGEVIGSLIDQQGDEASVEIIATFLPKIVVESLISALHRSGLEMEALTLEPIAAINVLIPPSMRRLNVALVDIGAGTSDIAITDMGTVIAYGMVPVAGDEITEAISDHYLLDFPLAEKAKRELQTNETITLTDILGFKSEIPKQEVITQITPALDHLANSICSEILSLNNNQSPKAVMLIGGGSLTPALPEKVASLLQLSSNRVAIRGIDAISSLSISEHVHKGPELVTPIGIAIAAYNTHVQYMTVYVNEQPIRLFEIKKLTVGDSLLAAGIKISKLYGKPGLAKVISLNNQMITIPGKLGTGPIIHKNGVQSSLDDQIQNGDIIMVQKGMEGEETNMQINDLVDHLPPLHISLNGTSFELPPRIICNGEHVSAKKLIEDRDVISVSALKTIEEVLEAVQMPDLILELEPFHLVINDSIVHIPSFTGKVLINGNEASKQAEVHEQDQVTVTCRDKLIVEKLGEIIDKKLFDRIPVFFNGQTITLSKKSAEVSRDGISLSGDDLLCCGDKITIREFENGPFIFQDLFSHVEIKMPDNAEGQYVLLKNNEHTTFYEPIAPGDKLNIIWPLVQEIY